MRPDSNLSHPSPGEPQATQAAQAAQAGPGRPARRARRRGLVLGAGAVLAIAGTVAGVTAAGAATGTGGRSTATGNAARAGQSGASRPGTGTAGQATGHQVTTHRASAGQASGQGSGSQASGSQGTGSPATGSPGAAHQPAADQAGRGGAGTATAGALRTSCHSVAHIGDSTSADLISAAFLPDASQRLAARYHDVGVRNVRIDASGGRSIVEVLPGQRNGFTVASGWRAQGYHGCWVIALGTNDAANIAAGSAVGMTARIDRMMAAAHGQPVLWVNTRTELSSGPWSAANERAWDRALTSALARYPNLRIFNWAAVAKPAWFLPDGIHYNTTGCAARARAIADALARAFPRQGHSKGKVVL